MSYIPSHAMPHTFAHDDDESAADRDKPVPANLGTVLKLAGAALAGLLVYRVLR